MNVDFKPDVRCCYNCIYFLAAKNQEGGTCYLHVITSDKVDDDFCQHGRFKCIRRRTDDGEITWDTVDIFGNPRETYIGKVVKVDMLKLES